MTRYIIILNKPSHLICCQFMCNKFLNLNYTCKGVMVKFFPLNLIFINLFETVLCNISNTRKSVSSDIQTMRSGLKKQGTAEFF